jgi:hypothetical protein
MSKRKVNQFGKGRLITLSIAVVALFGMSLIYLADWSRINIREEDTPPRIEFTWTPIGPVDLKEMRGYLRLEDDYSLDFTTYRMTIVELDRTFDLPIEGMIGREYETPISLSLLANDPSLYGKPKLTLRFAVSDDQGQAAELERTIHLKQPEGGLELLELSAE